MPDQEVLDWNNLANTRVGEVEPPKNIPDGHYKAVITGAGKTENRGQKKNLVISYPAKLVEPCEDVDQEAFAASDGFRANGYQIDWWLTPASLYRFTEFGKGVGASEDMSVQEMAEHIASCGEVFVVEAKSGISERTGRPFLNIENPIPLAEYENQQA